MRVRPKRYYFTAALRHLLFFTKSQTISSEKTEGLSFAQLRETYILGAQSAFENGREVGVGDVIEAIELQAAGAQGLKTLVSVPGFVHHPSLLAK